MTTSKTKLPRPPNKKSLIRRRIHDDTKRDCQIVRFKKTTETSLTGNGLLIFQVVLPYNDALRTKATNDTTTAFTATWDDAPSSTYHWNYLEETLFATGKNLEAVTSSNFHNLTSSALKRGCVVFAAGVAVWSRFRPTS
jgi:hypothetical protein